MEQQISDLEQLLQVHSAANPKSMDDQIVATMEHADWDDFWQVMVLAIIIKRRNVRSMVLAQKLTLTSLRTSLASCLSFWTSFGMAKTTIWPSE
jgi:hypothetical protein